MKRSLIETPFESLVDTARIPIGGEAAGYFGSVQLNPRDAGTRKRMSFVLLGDLEHPPI